MNKNRFELISNQGKNRQKGGAHEVVLGVVLRKTANVGHRANKGYKLETSQKQMDEVMQRGTGATSVSTLLVLFDVSSPGRCPDLDCPWLSHARLKTSIILTFPPPFALDISTSFVSKILFKPFVIV